MFRPGDAFAGFEILKELTGGAMGAVYLAWQAALGRHVIIKSLLPALANDPEYTKRFDREMKAMAQISHPSVVRVLTSGHDLGNRWIALELIHFGTGVDGLPYGLTFESKITGMPSIDDGLRVLTPVGDALDFVHDRGFVHRDVKPANILIDAQGAGVLADFGIVKPTTATFLTGDKAIGTVNYMAPEQCSAGDVDRRTDVYALGAVAYHWLVGQPPFPHGDWMAVALAHRDDPLPVSRLEQWPRAIPVLQKAMAKRPNDRYARAGEFMTALRAALTLPTSGATQVAVSTESARKGDGNPRSATNSSHAGGEVNWSTKPISEEVAVVDKPVMHHGVMISSTFVDVKDLRQVLMKAARVAGLHARAMEDEVLCDLVWKSAHAKPGLTAPVVRMGLVGKCFSLAAIR